MTEKEKIKLIIDCDAGTDDAYAICMAMSQDHVDVLAITCVEGNTSVDNVARNVLRILQGCSKMQVPVYKGCNRSIMGQPSIGSGFHGLDGLGDVPDPDAPSDDHLQTEHAVPTLIDIVNQNEGQITLVALGPLTNIAMAIRMDPAFGSKLKDFYMMGGNTEGKGNITKSSEFNVYSDPEAAYVVFHELQTTIHLFPLELCWKCTFTWEWYDKAVEMDTDKARQIKKWCKQTTDMCKSKGLSSLLVYDQVAVAAATNCDIVDEEKNLFATVELSGKNTRGQMVWDWNNSEAKAPNICLATKINADKLEKLMLLSLQS